MGTGQLRVPRSFDSWINLRASRGYLNNKTIIVSQSTFAGFLSRTSAFLDFFGDWIDGFLVTTWSDRVAQGFNSPLSTGTYRNTYAHIPTFYDYVRRKIADAEIAKYLYLHASLDAEIVKAAEAYGAIGQNRTPTKSEGQYMIFTICLRGVLSLTIPLSEMVFEAILEEFWLDCGYRDGPLKTSRNVFNQNTAIPMNIRDEYDTESRNGGKSSG